MTTTTANMGLSVPALNGDPGVWDTDLNASLALIDLHDHTTGKGVKVPTAGININADLTFAGYSATNLKGSVYTAQASAPASLAVYVKNADLYFKDGNANEVRMTASGALNIATTGGIAGDYVGAAASVYFDSVNEVYRFLLAAPAPNDWAYVAAGGVDLYEHASGIATRVRLLSPAALAASYQVTFPAALPGSTLLTQVSSAGVMTWSNTIANAVTMSASLQVGTTLGVTGAATLSSTLETTGLITAKAGLTADANQHVTVSGTGRFKHGQITRRMSSHAGSGGWSAASGYMGSGGANWWYLPIPLADGERLVSMIFYHYGDGAGASTLTYSVVKYDASAVAAPLSGPTVLDDTAAWHTESVAGINYTSASGESVVLEFSASGANLRVGNITYVVDRP